MKYNKKYRPYYLLPGYELPYAKKPGRKVDPTLADGWLLGFDDDLELIRLIIKMNGKIGQEDIIRSDNEGTIEDDI